MTFFFDNDLSPKIPRILVVMDHEACHLRDHFAPDVRDVEWIRHCGSEGWAIVTLDNHIRKNTAERIALSEAETPAIFIARSVGQRQVKEQVLWFIKHWDGVSAKLYRWRPGVIFAVGANGVITEVRI